MFDSKTLQVNKFITMKHITEITGLTNKWFYQLIKDGKFPQPIKFGRSSRWLASDVADWINDRIIEARPNIEANKLFEIEDVCTVLD